MARSPARAKYAKVTHRQPVDRLLGDGKISARKCVAAEIIRARTTGPRNTS